MTITTNMLGIFFSAVCFSFPFLYANENHSSGVNLPSSNQKININNKKYSPASTGRLKNGQENSKPLNEEKENNAIAFFKPPSGWFVADSNALLPSVKIMVIGNASSSLPPSINLSMEYYPFSLKQYLKNVKNKNAAEGNEWKDLGLIKTQTGNASLSQVDSKTQWGNLRRMHVILFKDNWIYILTAAALVDEFPLYYKDFFESMRSLKVTSDPYELVADPKDKKDLKEAADDLQTKWKIMINQKKSENPLSDEQAFKQSIFNETQFQETIWKPFKQSVEKKTEALGPQWQNLYFQKIENELLKP